MWEVLEYPFGTAVYSHEQKRFTNVFFSPDAYEFDLNEHSLGVIVYRGWVIVLNH